MNQIVKSDANLVELACQINDCAKRAEHLAGQVRDKAKEAICEAILCGGLLLQAKQQVKHGEWLDWLDQNCEVSKQTANRYMALAASKNSHVSNLESANSLRQAYQLAGIIPHDEQKQQPETNPEPEPEPKPQDSDTPKPARENDRVSRAMAIADSLLAILRDLRKEEVARLSARLFEIADYANME